MEANERVEGRRAFPRRSAIRVLVALLGVFLLIALYNDFAIRGRLEHSFAAALPARSGLRLRACRRLPIATLWECRVTGRAPRDRGRRPVINYQLDLRGRCWGIKHVRVARSRAAVAVSHVPRRLTGCLAFLYALDEIGTITRIRSTP